MKKQNKISLNKQTVQKLDSRKLNNIHAGNAQGEEAGTTWLLSAATSTSVVFTGPVTITVTAACTAADAQN